MGSGYGKRRLAAEDAGTFVEKGSDVTGFVVAAPHATSMPSVKASKPVVSAAAPKPSPVSTNVAPTKQVLGVQPSYSVTPGGPYTGGSLKI